MPAPGFGAQQLELFVPCGASGHLGCLAGLKDPGHPRPPIHIWNLLQPVDSGKACHPPACISTLVAGMGSDFCPESHLLSLALRI